MINAPRQSRIPVTAVHAPDPAQTDRKVAISTGAGTPDITTMCRTFSAGHFQISRRAFAIGTAVTLLSGCHTRAGSDSVVDPVPPPDAGFLLLSRRLTGHADLDPLTSDRISLAFAQLFPAVKAKFAQIEDLAGHNANPADLMMTMSGHGLEEAAQAIIAAWYKGTVGNGATGISVAYADALMNRPVADAVAPPTYQLGGPGWWTAEPPPVGVSAPVERTKAKSA